MVAEWYKLQNIAEKQWDQDLKGWLKHYDIEDVPENICLQWEIESEDWEELIRGADLYEDEESLLRRTVVAMARLVVKVKVSNDDMKRGIGNLQDGIEE